MIASVISSPSASSENSLISRRMNAEISSGLYSRARARIFTSPLTARTISYGRTSRACWVSSASYLRPTRRFTAKTVFIGFVIAWRFAIWPTSRSPSSVKPTIEGVVRLPSRFVRTWCVAPSTTDTQQFVVPRSMPRIFPTLPPSCSGLSAGLGLVGFRLADRHLDEGRPDEAVVQEVALLERLQDRVRRDAVRDLGCDRLVQVRVE